jgi:hypothetical protein
MLLEVRAYLKKKKLGWLKIKVKNWQKGCGNDYLFSELYSHLKGKTKKQKTKIGIMQCQNRETSLKYDKLEGLLIHHYSTQQTVFSSSACPFLHSSFPFFTLLTTLATFSLYLSVYLSIAIHNSYFFYYFLHSPQSFLAFISFLHTHFHVKIVSLHLGGKKFY